MVNKPANLVTQGALPGVPSLVLEAQAYLREKYQKPGNVYVGVVSRLDSLVTGLIVLARTSKAAARLNRQFADQSTQKKYWAMVTSDHQLPTRGELSGYIAKDESAQRMRYFERATSQTQTAELKFRKLGTIGTTDLLEVELITGRKHQIRVQLAHYGAFILGDRKYGSTRPFPQGIALHSQYLQIEHPTQKVPLKFQVSPPNYWQLERFSID